MGKLRFKIGFYLVLWFIVFLVFDKIMRNEWFYISYFYWKKDMKDFGIGKGGNGYVFLYGILCVCASIFSN